MNISRKLDRHRTGSRWLLMLAVAPLAALAFAGSTAQAAPGYVGQIRNDGNFKCLDLRSEDDYIVQLWDCTNTTNQQWIYGTPTVINGVSYIQIVNWRTGGCLEPAGGAVESLVPLVVDPCANTDSQFWAVHNPGPSAAYLVNKHSGLCLDLRNNNSANGTIIWQYWCNFTNAQWWTAQFGGW